jgi:predicted DCC family thiol-disulfide oxidoreductase YuxK
MAWVLFFDGDCAFCSRSIRRVVRFDPDARIAFAPLQGELAQQKGFTHHAAKGGGTMVLLRESDGQVFLHSDAWIELAHTLGGAWRLLTLARWIPKPLRDGLYHCFAKNRHRLMGQSDSCTLADPILLKRLRS